MARVERAVPYALIAIEALARRNRVLDDRDVRDALQQPIGNKERRAALDEACRRQVLHRRKNQPGLFDSLMYEG
jgi:hypothetical protein